MTVKLKKSACPKCLKVLDAASCITEEHENEVPKPGDITICSRCGIFLEFSIELKLQYMTKETHDKIPPYILERMNRVSTAIKLANKIRFVVFGDNDEETVH